MPPGAPTSYGANASTSVPRGSAQLNPHRNNRETTEQ
jgi:hypothetical protein